MASSTSPDEPERRIVEDLFFEQEVDILAISYRPGVLRSIVILLRSLVFSRPQARSLQDVVTPGSSVAVGFFANDIRALASPPAGLRIDVLLHINLHRLSLVRERLGWGGLVRESARFVRLALALKGWRWAGRLTYPLLGWLLYKSFRSLLTAVPGVTLVTTNMQHPASLGVVWAAVTTGCPTDFYEHATTPRIVARDRGYRNTWVEFAHTRDMLIEQGFDPAGVHAVRGADQREIEIERRPLRVVGLCINAFDAFETIIDISDVLQERGLQVVYRVHDADPRLARLRRLAAQRGIGVSDARASGIFDFLERVDLVIAGNSNVLADAFKARRAAVYYWSGRADMYDYYGLVGWHRIPEARDKPSLHQALDALVGADAVC